MCKSKGKGWGRYIEIQSDEINDKIHDVNGMLTYHFANVVDDHLINPM